MIQKKNEVKKKKENIFANISAFSVQIKTTHKF